MSIEFILPDLGEGIHEAEVQSVMVKEGDMVTLESPADAAKRAKKKL